MYKLYYKHLLYGYYPDIETAYKAIYRISQQKNFIIDSFINVEALVKTFDNYTDIDNEWAITSPDW